MRCDYLTTAHVCARLALRETTLRHVLRRPDAPRPALHPSARLFLWSREDVDRLAAYLGKPAPHWSSDDVQC